MNWLKSLKNIGNHNLKAPDKASIMNKAPFSPLSEGNLSVLQVIDQLIVGPVHIEPTRLVMPYTVIRGGAEDTNKLIYKYEEAVFESTEPASQNLAAMIGAQLALNYGLFCKEIIFNGLFDHSDRRFLLGMMENTSKEILVKKIYEPNIFLSDAVKQIPIQKQAKYTQATVTFVNTQYADNSLEWSYWATSRDKHCVLSSGGKDSLLAYSLLKEIGKEVYPIFGNESGRHWFTALNGYRFSKETDPNTGRVWMNADRIFAWMLRHLSFIRQDFANVRSDDYPIRLWTVAVFLFGVLPLMRKHGIGRLIIGDEYDSTQRSHFHGISHYNGLYDQSRFFDEAMSRFFLKKGWAVSQFSILRPLSEMLILKILAKRYPDIQQHQTSCHAAHEKEGRIYPCGQCEKCRRVVSMLTALEVDPKNCGYSNEQTVAAFKSLKTNKIKQISSDASHLFYLLAQKGIIEPGARPHPEIMQLRFDKERSHIDGIPLDLRQPLFEIMLAYADGAVQRVDRKWQAIDLLNHPELSTSYPFEQEGTNHKQPKNRKHQKSDYFWAHLSWEEAEQRIRETDTVLLPVGAIEQHGLHLPLDVDAFDAAYLAQKGSRSL
jgi:hypothetical protein